MTRILTLEEIGNLDGDRFDQELKRSARHAWESSYKYIRLASCFGVAVFTATSSISLEGEYIDGSVDDDWNISNKLRDHLNVITEKQNKPVILIDINIAFLESGIANVIAHEIGHHLDFLANPNPEERIPQRKFVTAFNRAKLYNSSTASDLFSELIAETLGQYLCGHKLNSVLLTEVDTLLAKLSCSHRLVVQAFRNASTATAFLNELEVFILENEYGKSLNEVAQ